MNREILALNQYTFLTEMLIILQNNGINVSVLQYFSKLSERENIMEHEWCFFKSIIFFLNNSKQKVFLNKLSTFTCKLI